MATEQRDGNAQWKRFSGDDLDGKAYRRWKLWVEAKMAASKDITSKRRGPFVYCLLDHSFGVSGTPDLREAPGRIR